MTFHHPIWLFMLIPLPLLALLRVWSQVSSGKGGEALVSSRLRNELIVGASQGLRWTIFLLNLIGLGLLVVALARPQWGFHEAESVSEGRNLIIAIDTSRSMLANDLTPDRMTRAKLAAQDIVTALPEDRIGLIAFAGKAFLQAPLTVDHDAILESIDQLDTEIIPRGGTNLYAPVQLALDTFSEAESKDSGLIIFSDGEDLEGGELMTDLKAKAAELGMTIVAIGVGTEEGSIIPDPGGQGQFVRDESGNVVRSRLNPTAMQNLTAESGAGAYVNLGGASSITSLVKKSLESLSKTRLDDQKKRVPIERFMWPLAGAVFCWLVAFLLPASSRALSARRQGNRAPVPATPLTVRGRSITAWAVGFGILFSAGGIFADESVEEISVGFQALRDGDYEDAVTEYTKEIRDEKSGKKKRWLNLGLGSAAYFEGDYEEAQQAFGEVLASAGSAEELKAAHFALGNSLFRKGKITIGLAENPNAQAAEMPRKIPDGGVRQEARTQWESAIEHYEAVLNYNPADKRAKRNIAVTEEYLEYLDKLDEQEKKEQQEEEEKQEEEKKDEEEKQDEEKEDEEKEEEEQKDENEHEQEEQQEDQNNQDQESQENDPNNEQSQEENGEEQEGDDQKSEQDSKDDGEQEPNDRDSQEQNSESENGEEKEGEDGSQEQQQQQQQQQQDGNQSEPFDPKSGDTPPPEDRDREGELEANPNQAQQQQPAMSPEQIRQAAANQMKNPETGYSPTEARKMLRALSDESMEVRPIFEPVKPEKFDDW